MNSSLMVADVGNSSIHIGEFPNDDKSTQLTNPIRTVDFPANELDFDVMEDWINKSESRQHRWRVGSVNRRSLDSFLSWLEQRNVHVHIVTYEDFDLSIVLKCPDKIGIDRLAAAAAANRLRSENHAAIVVDAGTAITIDCVTGSGQFIGGMIAPGLQSGFTILERNTDQLPNTSLDASPGLIGDNTTHAIQAGVYWMAVGGIENVIAKLKNELASPCRVFVTGGSMQLIYPNLQIETKHVPHLVLSGLALAKS